MFVGGWDDAQGENRADEKSVNVGLNDGCHTAGQRKGEKKKVKTGRQRKVREGRRAQRRCKGVVGSLMWTSEEGTGERANKLEAEGEGEKGEERKRMGGGCARTVKDQKEKADQIGQRKDPLLKSADWGGHPDWMWMQPSLVPSLRERARASTAVAPFPSS